MGGRDTKTRMPRVDRQWHIVEKERNKDMKAYSREPRLGVEWKRDKGIESRGRETRHKCLE